MENTDPKIDQKRKEFALQFFKENPNMVSNEIQAKILAQQIIIGMAPYDAYLAGGAFAFKVQADPAKWPSNTDPYKVMWSQSLEPDNSEIWMTFQNKTQFPGEGKQSFRVYVRNGKAAQIERLEA